MIEQPLSQSTKVKINQSNHRYLWIYLLALVCLDLLFYVIAKIDQTYPSNPELLKLMVVTIVMEFALLLLVYKYYDKSPFLIQIVVPMSTIGIKLFYGTVMTMDHTLIYYCMGMYLILSMLLLTRWEVVITGLSFQVVLLVLLMTGQLWHLEDAYAVIIISVMVVLMAGLWNRSRYKHYIEEALIKEELINQKREIEKLISLRELAIDLNHNLIAHTEIESYFKYILKKLLAMVENTTSACILLDNNGYLQVEAYYNYKEDEINAFKIRTEDSFAYKKGAIGARSPMIINDLDELIDDGFPDTVLSEDGKRIKSSLVTPLSINDAFYGLLNLDSAENRIFTEKDVEMMRYIGEQVSIVLENHKLYRRVTELSKYDQLTGFYNRWYLKEIKEHHYPLWCRENTNVYVAIFDLDNLKHVNDNFGHDVGDLYIKEFCNLLKNAFRKTDQFIRNGGDEFLGLFFSIEPENLEEKLLEVQKNFEKHTYDNEKVHFKSSFSYGIVKLKCQDETIEHALKRADQKMYKYKHENRQNVYKEG